MMHGRPASVAPRPSLGTKGGLTADGTNSAREGLHLLQFNLNPLYIDVDLDLD